MQKTLHLVIPGLLGPWRNRDEAGFPKSQANALERLLSRAAMSEVGFTGAEATLFDLFQLDTREPPVAAVTRLVDAGRADPGWWLRADPVHLRADLRQVLLFDARELDITLAEAQSLVADFNRMFRDDGWSLEALHPRRWYLRLEDDPGLRMCPLSDAIGRDISSRLPEGKASGRWHGLLTEIQMLFHGAGANLERESRGQPPINSVWFWGGGRLPGGAHAFGEGVYGSGALIRGLARLAGIAVSPPPESADEWQQAACLEANNLVLLEATRYDVALNDPYRWAEHVNGLDNSWFAACLIMLEKKKLDALYLYPCNGRLYRLTRGDLRRFWRRALPLSHFL